jgi:hypothetical protein
MSKQDHLGRRRVRRAVDDRKIMKGGHKWQ